MFRMLAALAILMWLLSMMPCKPYVYQAQLLKSDKSDCPRSVILLSDRHECPLPEWAVAMDQSELVLQCASKFNGYIVVEDGASAVVPFSEDKQIRFAQSFRMAADLDLCCAAVSVTTEPRLRKLADALHDKNTSANKVPSIRDTIAADAQTRACRFRVVSQLQENSLLFLALRSARRGIGVENVECRHLEIDRTTWKGLQKMLAHLDSNLQQVALLKECPLVGFSYKRLEALGYRTRVFNPVVHYLSHMHVVADRNTQLMDLIRMEDQARSGAGCFKDVVRSMSGFFRDFNSIYAPVVQEVSRLSLSEFYCGAQILIFSILGAPILDLKILKAIYEHRLSPLVIVCAGGYHIESIRPCLEQFGYTSVLRAGSHNNRMATPPVDIKRFFDLVFSSQM